MRRRLPWVGTWGIGLIVAAALVFGASQALARDVDGEYCMTEPWHLGFCPPYTTPSCDTACEEAQYGGGSCEYYDNGWCCACME